MERNEKTRALLAAFGCALAYLLAGKALTAVLPQVPEEAARMWAFEHRCAAAPIVEELVFRAGQDQVSGLNSFRHCFAMPPPSRREALAERKTLSFRRRLPH